MDPLLIICGPTASGKTSLAISLAKKYNGELVSADSRQLYQGLNILTGKDLPNGSVATVLQKVKVGDASVELVTYSMSEIPVWMYDLAPATELLSISIYKKAALIAIENIRKRGKLPILVGGSGLYIKSITDSIETIDIPQNNSLRSELTSISLEGLQQRLSAVDPKKFASMNHSDIHNPRRLIRAIEVGVHNHDVQKATPARLNISQNFLWIGLKHTNTSLSQAVSVRVESRWQDGAIDEVRSLRGIPANTQLATSLGIQPILSYIKGDLTEIQAKSQWISQEIAYAKRQMVWFQKNSRIRWFDATDKAIQNQVEMLVGSWYTECGYETRKS